MESEEASSSFHKRESEDLLHFGTQLDASDHQDEWKKTREVLDFPTQLDLAFPTQLDEYQKLPPIFNFTAPSSSSDSSSAEGTLRTRRNPLRQETLLENTSKR